MQLHESPLLQPEVLVARPNEPAFDPQPWAVNEEVVARAIVACRVPVVSAVGHEIDVSIADLVADRRALTPSEAAELVVPSHTDIRQQLMQMSGRLYRLMTDRVERLRMRLDGYRERPILQRPGSLIDARRQLLDELAARADRAIRLTVERRRQNLTTIAAALDALSPLKVLSRGYSLTTDESGTVVNSIESVRPGDRITTRVADGSIESMVENTRKETL